MLSMPNVVSDPLKTYVSYRILPDLVQRHLLRDRWAIDIEADSGERCRVNAKTRKDAIGYARQIHAGVQEQGVVFLKTFAR